MVNDFHPALLLGGFLQGDDLPIVHVHGSDQWRAMERPFQQPVGSWVNPVYERLLRRLRHAGVARIVHRPLAGFRADWTASEHVELPPLVPHADGRVGVAQAIGQRLTEPEAGAGDRPQVAAYLNPHFRDPDVPRAIEGATERLEAKLEGVAERFTDRTGWRRREPGFTGRAAEADLLVSAPATEMIGLSRTYGLPLLMVLSNRPEQRRNARQYLSASEEPPRLSTCAASLLDADNSAAERSRVDGVQATWSRAVATIVERLKSRPVRSYPAQRQIIDGSGPVAGGRRSN
ncbi:MAG: hypothetical protein ABEN55_02025 [Bradymonadaceae bacterium]